MREAALRSRLLHERSGDYARVALANIQREFPTQAVYHLTAPGRLAPPRDQHPAFYGSYDWHSCVEMHWVLVRLLRLYPDLAGSAEIRGVLGRHLSAEALATEARVFADPARRSFERPYGWGWLLMLAEELALLDDADGEAWRAHLRPLVDVLSGRLREWLPKATYPLRTGLHGNSAFGARLALAFAQRESEAGRGELEHELRAAALRWFANDADYPAAWEPSGSDFLSPALTEAELMSCVLDHDTFDAWLDRFLPALADGEPEPLLTPVIVSDASDPQIAHLHGLNLSRAWCMRRLIETLGARDERSIVLASAMQRHADASLDVAVGSDYMVEHWLAAYALLLLSE